jgi:hypothetical protein
VVLKEFKAHKVLVHKDHKDQVVYKVHRAHREILAHKDHKAQQVPAAHKDIMD